MRPLRRLWAEARLALMLLTRLPVGSLPEPAPPMGAAFWAYPLAGAVVATAPALLYWGGAQVWPPLLAALLALGLGILLTGALHEDGLADLADSSGGSTRARKLEILRDSRIGSYGALALILSIGLRATALASAPTPAMGAWALVGLAAASRAPLPWMMVNLPPARPGGLGAAAQAGATKGGVWAAAALGGALVGVAFSGFSFWGVAILPAMFFAACGVAWWAMRRLGGYTGDVLGAMQQAAEITGWLSLAALWRSSL